MKLREEAERCIKPRSEDPMKRTANRKAESIPTFSQSVHPIDMQYMGSQESMEHSLDRLNASKLSMNSQNSENNESDNPFLKRKSNHESI
jgi:hypothetical protein